MANLCVLMVASGASWESTALGFLNARPGIVVLKRCVDVNDLLATASAGQADVAILALDAHGLDLAAVDHLRRHRVRPIGVTGDPDSEDASARAARVGVTSLVAEGEIASLADVVLAVDLPADVGPEELDLAATELPETSGSLETGRVVVVWGPGGAPGRTTIALGLAAELARRGASTLVVDADPYGGSVSQHLGIMDEVSGLLSAARLSSSGGLEDGVASTQLRVADQLHVITGLPRADRFVEIRPGSIEHILAVGSSTSHVIVDTGFSLEDAPGAEFGSLPGRNSMTLGALAAADEIIVVGSADPVGLSRLARGLVDLKETTRGAPVRVVINRMRPSLGWSEADISGMVEGFSRVLGLHFLPEDRAAVDRALIAGRTLVEAGESALLRAIEELASQVVPGLTPAVASGGGSLRRRTLGRARKR